MHVNRDLEKNIIKYLKLKWIIAVIGTRQCGKTIYQPKLVKELLQPLRGLPS
jgi:predicted AAA+ superfamily ATPase